jgi:prolyl-tRNA synthetase
VERLKKAGLRVKSDLSDQSPGWKFAEYEMKGVPLRIEIGPKDIEKGQCIAVRRDNGEKIPVPLTELETRIPELLDAVEKGLYEKAKKNLTENTRPVKSMEEAKAVMAEHGGFIKAMWCDDLACETAMKEEVGVSSRCIPFEQEHIADTCVCCGKPADKMVVWGVAY